MNAAMNLFYRAIKLTSIQFRDKSIEKAKNMLMEILEGLINKALNVVKHTVPQLILPKQYRSLKYIQSCSEDIVRVMKPHLNNIQIAYNPNNKC